LTSRRTSTSTSRCGRVPRGLARTRLVVPALLVGLVSATALATGATSAAAASPGAQRAAASDDCLFGVICLPGQTPSPTTTPAAPVPTTTSPSAPIFPAPTGTTPAPGGSPAPTTPGGPGGLQLGEADAESCAASAFPSRNATSNTAKLDYAAALGTCHQAVASGDAKVKAAAADDGSTPLIANDLSHLVADKLSVDGFAYDGLSTLQTKNGPIQVMTFSADKVQIDAMSQSYPFPGGKVTVGNTGTAVLQGHVKLYVTQMTSKVLGLIKIRFDTGFQPPLVLPSMFFTEVDTDIALVECDQILLSKLKLPVAAG
jgi:hypothetical protein